MHYKTTPFFSLMRARSLNSRSNSFFAPIPAVRTFSITNNQSVNAILPGQIHGRGGQTVSHNPARFRQSHHATNQDTTTTTNLVTSNSTTTSTASSVVPSLPSNPASNSTSNSTSSTNLSSQPPPPPPPPLPIRCVSF